MEFTAEELGVRILKWYLILPEGFKLLIMEKSLKQKNPYSFRETKRGCHKPVKIHLQPPPELCRKTERDAV
jgi:hypothetical protein